MIKCFEQSHLARKTVSELWFNLLIFKAHVLPPSRFRSSVEKGVLTLIQKPLRLRVRLSIF